MKLNLTLTVNDTQKAWDSTSTIAENERGEVDGNAIQMMIYGMLQSALMNIRVIPPPQPTAAARVDADASLEQASKQEAQ